MDAERALASAEENLAAAGRSLRAVREVGMYADRDAATEYRRAPLPERTVIPFDAPAGMAIVEVPGAEPFRHLGIPGLSVTVCGKLPPNAVPGFASGLDAIDCLDCLDIYTQMLVRS